MTMQPLFRPQAVAHATQRLDGDVLLPVPLVTWGAAAFVFAVLALGAWFAGTATYTRTQSVQGWLTPEGGVTRAVSRRDGNVLAVMVAEGDLVEAGAPLARVGGFAPGNPNGGPARDPSTWNEESSPPSSDGPFQKFPRDGDHIVAAPIRGRVDALVAREGQYVSRGSTLALVAASDELVAEIMVPSHVAGLVTSGQSLRLKYDGLAGHQGVQQGIVTRVSRTPFAADDPDAAAIPVDDPVYRAQVRLPSQKIDVGGVSVMLRAGMRLTAEIPAPRRTVLQALYETIG
ncbi:MAG: HlyD family efflux transporter periplasmic adaptor subunit [Gammaproteobacteria bacterium]|nr:HlyD family efflux transporter periplasmic adaptor subunit [Gammaproteobacteria bacterium]MYF30736.1 HlyD family efflux transporter periplasmic adaptor subunit [Gammaproteobacteria bacterium]MYK48365.1 HlyD family efflux transporter periplasmic adaptor subunit [Gammaproteobacteria bacterium]